VRLFADPGELLAAVGSRLGESGPRVISQDEVDAFAALTDDRQWIHVDPDRARRGPFGGAIVHGMLTLSLIVSLLDEVFRVDGVALVLNKGFDRVRFAGPVPVGARVRLIADLAEAAARAHGFTEAVIAVAMLVDGQERPAYRASVRLLYQEVS
jgi:acyl dehydratase